MTLLNGSASMASGIFPGAGLTNHTNASTNIDTNTASNCNARDTANSGEANCGGGQLSSRGLLHQYWLVLVVILACVQLIVITLNGLTIGVFLRARLYRSRTNMGLLTLAISDLLMALVPSSLLITTLVHGHWPFQRLGCVVYASSFITFGLASVTTVSVIALERYISVVRNDATGMKEYWPGIIAGIWLTSIMVALLPVFGWSSYRLDPATLMCGVDWASEKASDKALPVLLLFVFICLPIGVESVCYCKVFHKVHQVARRVGYSRVSMLAALANHVASRISLPEETNRLSLSWMPGLRRANSQADLALAGSRSAGRPTRQSTTSIDSLRKMPRFGDMRNARRLACVMVATVMLTALGWLPYAVTSLLASLTADVTPEIVIMASLSALISTVFNSVVYVFLNKKYRGIIKSSFTSRRSVIRLTPTTARPGAVLGHVPPEGPTRKISVIAQEGRNLGMSDGLNVATTAGLSFIKRRALPLPAFLALDPITEHSLTAGLGSTCDFLQNVATLPSRGTTPAPVHTSSHINNTASSPDTPTESPDCPQDSHRVYKTTLITVKESTAFGQQGSQTDCQIRLTTSTSRHPIPASPTPTSDTN